MDAHGVTGPQQPLMQVQLQECAAELLVVTRAEPLSEIVVVLIARYPIQPCLHELAGMLPEVPSDPVQELEGRFAVLRWPEVRAISLIEDRLAIPLHRSSILACSARHRRSVVAGRPKEHGF